MVIDWIDCLYVCVGGGGGGAGVIQLLDSLKDSPEESPDETEWTM